MHLAESHLRHLVNGYLPAETIRRALGSNHGAIVIRLLVAQPLKDAQDFTPGRIQSTAVLLVLLHRQHEFDLGGSAVSIAGRGVDQCSSVRFPGERGSPAARLVAAFVQSSMTGESFKPDRSSGSGDEVFLRAMGEFRRGKTEKSTRPRPLLSSSESLPHDHHSLGEAISRFIVD